MEGKQALEGTVTILFTDVVGSSSLATTLGDEAAQELMRAYGRIVREGIEKHEGYEVKTIGDAFMVAFNSCVRAVACSCDIQRGLAWHNRLHPEHPLVVRMGMNCGEVIRERGDFFGAVRSGEKSASAPLLEMARERPNGPTLTLSKLPKLS